MPIVIKSPADIERMRAAGLLVARIHARMREVIKPGITTGELDAIAVEMLAEAGAEASFLGYQGTFPASICASVNEVLVHGFPGPRALREGDIISVDIGAYLHGFHGDAAVTYPVGKVSQELQELIATAERCFWVGLEKVRAGNRMGDVSAAIQREAESNGYSVIREYGGHGIGRKMHEEPSVLNWGEPGTGTRLQNGMTFAIEPMIALGSAETLELEDGWTVVMADGRAAAHYEHTVLVNDDQPVILTAPE
jgi:methionyl aminopeptidase